MQTSVLLSIKPQFVESIFAGTKQFEFRRRIFKNRDVKRVIIYSTAPISRVVGEFEIDEIIESEIPKLWKKTKKYSGIQKSYFEAYFNGLEKGYAIKIKKVTIYENPLELKSDFNIKHAPQFFIYLNNVPQNINLRYFNKKPSIRDSGHPVGYLCEPSLI